METLYWSFVEWDSFSGQRNSLTVTTGQPISLIKEGWVINITVSETPFSFISVGPSHEPKTVVCYCAVGYRASIMANRLIDELQKPENQELKSDMDVYNLEGSIFKWANERKDLVEPSGQSTTLVNTVSPFWGLLVYKEMRARDD